MKKLSFILIAILLATLGTWYFWPEYGDSYSEQQRQLWNQRRGLMHPLCIESYDNEGIIKPDTSGLKLFSGLKIRRYEQAQHVVKQSIKIDKALQQQQFQLRNQLAPSCSFVVNKQGNEQELPQEGLSSVQLKEQIKQGDTTAPLTYLLRISAQNEYRNPALNSWMGFQNARQHLMQAAQYGSRTAPFLLRYLETMRDTAAAYDRKAYYATSTPFQTPKVPIFHGLESMPGYQEFHQELLQGNYEDFAVLECIIPEQDKDVLKRDIYNHLLSLSKKGDLQAQRHLVRMILEMFEQVPFRKDNAIREVHTAAANAIGRIPGFRNISYSLATGLVRLGIYTPEDSTEWAYYSEASQYAYRTARQGDLTCMYLWLRFGIETKDYFSQEEWENIFAFTHRLLETGYTPFIDYVSTHEAWPSLYQLIIRSYYPPASWERIVQQCMSEQQKSVIERPEDQFTYNLGYSDLGYAVSEFEKTFRSADPSTLHELEEWCDTCYRDGHLPALYAFARIYSQGIGVPKNPGKAYLLLKRALSEAIYYPNWTVYCDDNKDLLFRFGLVVNGATQFENSVKLQLISLVLDHPEFPGRDEQEAFQLANSMYHKFSGSPDDGPYLYVLGRIYEQGTGTPVDLRKALNYYKLSVLSKYPNTGCEKRYQKLVDEIGEEQEEDKASLQKSAVPSPSGD